jgi:TAP-like protein
MLSKSMASCLARPDLTAYDVERVDPLEFPKNLSNKMLVIGVTGDPVTPYHSVLNTYNLTGSGNANFLVHDAMGRCSTANPNNCTTAALNTYFTTSSALPLQITRLTPV